MIIILHMNSDNNPEKQLYTSVNPNTETPDSNTDLQNYLKNLAQELFDAKKRVPKGYAQNLEYLRKRASGDLTEEADGVSYISSYLQDAEKFSKCKVGSNEINMVLNALAQLEKDEENSSTKVNTDELSSQEKPEKEKFRIGMKVKVKYGRKGEGSNFGGFSGAIDSIDENSNLAKVKLNIFGRESITEIKLSTLAIVEEK